MAQPSEKSAIPGEAAPGDDAGYYRQILHAMIDEGAELVRILVAQAKADPLPHPFWGDKAPVQHPTEHIADCYERVTRSIRRSIALARTLDSQPRPHATRPPRPDPETSRPETPEKPEARPERPERPESAREFTADPGRPIAEIIAELREDLDETRAAIRTRRPLAPRYSAKRRPAQSPPSQSPPSQSSPSQSSPSQSSRSQSATTPSQSAPSKPAPRPPAPHSPAARGAPAPAPNQPRPGRPHQRPSPPPPDRPPKRRSG